MRFGLPFTLKRVKTAGKRLRTKTLLVALTMTSLRRKHVRCLHDRKHFGQRFHFQVKQRFQAF